MSQISKEFFDGLLLKLAKEQGRDDVPASWPSILAAHMLKHGVELDQPEQPRKRMSPGYYLGNEGPTPVKVTDKLYLVEEPSGCRGFSLIYGHGDWRFWCDAEQADEVGNAFANLEGEVYADAGSLLAFIGRSFHIAQQTTGALFHKGVEISAANMEQTQGYLANPEWVVNTGRCFDDKKILKELIDGEE
jgi:hypothetical protein